MTGNLTLAQLKDLTASGEIDTVIACMVDMQGRLQGKRFLAQHFVETAWEETHCCNYLLATDLEMSTVEGYESTSWSAGYGDYMMKPDLSTLRRAGWLERSAMVLCDVLDHHGHAPIAHSPRAMLQTQIDRLAAMGLEAITATELEFFIFKKSFEAVHQEGYRDLAPLTDYNADYAILLATKDEPVMHPLRMGLAASGVPVEGSKGEAEAGQEELNIRYGPAQACAEYHTISKHAAKEIGFLTGHAVSFMPKWDHRRVGSASHVHQSLWTTQGKPAFHDPDADLGLSELGRHYLGGLLKYASDITFFMAPFVNSYKRFQAGSFAPT
ncbi:MAG: glutamine synthetase, partial [Rhodobacterales bacterium CG2_30_65_12]